MSPLLLSHHWEPARSRDLDEIEAEVLECESLGIPRLQLAGTLDVSRAQELLHRLEQRRAEVSLIVPVAEEGVELLAPSPSTLGGVHLGRVGSAGWDLLVDRVARIRSVLPGVGVVAELRLDDLEPGRLSQLERLSHAGLRAELSLGLQPLSHPAWSSFLRSPTRSFRPPLLASDERGAHQLLREGRELLGPLHRRPSLRRRALSRLARILRP